MRAFDYRHAASRDEAIRVATSQAAASSAQFLAGGTTLIDLMKLDVMRPTTLVDINGLADELGDVQVQGGSLRLGGARIGLVAAKRNAASKGSLKIAFAVLIFVVAIYMIVQPALTMAHGSRCFISLQSTRASWNSGARRSVDLAVEYSEDVMRYIPTLVSALLALSVPAFAQSNATLGGALSGSGSNTSGRS